MKKIVLIIFAISIHAGAWAQCSGISATGTTRAKTTKVCYDTVVVSSSLNTVVADTLTATRVTVTSLTDGLIKSVSDVLTPAVAGTDYSTPSSLSDSLDNYLKLLGGTMAGDIDLGSNDIISGDKITTNNILINGTLDDGTDGTIDGGLRVKRTISSGSTSQHSIVTATDFRLAGLSSCAVDMRDILNSGSAANFDHLIGLQSRIGHNTEGTTNQIITAGDYIQVNDGTVSNIIGFLSNPTIVASFGGTAVDRYGVWVKDVEQTGVLSGVNYGVYVSSLTRGVTNNYAIYTAGSTPSYFGGTIIVDTISGSTSSGGNLKFQSTTNPTKGKILLGSGSAYDESIGFIGVGTQSPAAQLHMAGNYSASSWTTNGIRLRSGSQTFNDNTSSGTVTNMYIDNLGIPTITATNVTTYTNAVGSYFMNPSASTNVTITNGYSLGTQGNVLLGGSVTLSNAGSNTGINVPAATNFNINTGGSNSNRVKIIGATGLIGIGPTAPTPSAYLTIAAGTASASSSPLKLTRGPLLTTAEQGAWGYGLNGRLFFSPSTTWKNIPVSDTAAAANGKILIGNGTDYTVSNITAGDNITITNGSGTIEIASTGGTVVTRYQLSYTGQANSTTQGLFKASINSTGLANTPSTSSGSPGFENGGSDPVIIPAACTLTRVRIKFAQAAVSTGTVGTPTVRMTVYRVDNGSRTNLGNVDITISATGVQTFNNLGVTSPQTAESSLQSISLSAGDLIGLEFTNQSGTNDGINALGRIFAVITTEE